MSVAVASDPQFAFPTRPQLVPGLVRIETADGLIVEGGPSRQAFQGATATGQLPRVMQALDGTAEVPELAERLDIDLGRLWPMLSLLYATGLVEEGFETPCDDAALAFLSRSVDTTRVNRNGAQARDRLTAAVVQVVTDEAHAEFASGLAELLRFDGVGTVQVQTVGLDVVDPASASAPAGTTILVAVGDSPRVAAAALAARADRIPVLPVLRDGGEVHVGPLLDPEHAACARCALDQRARVTNRDIAADATVFDGIAAPLVARDLLTMIARVGTSNTERFLVSTTLPTLTQTARVITPDPSCVVCMDPPSPGTGIGEGLPVAWAYSHSVAFPPRTSVNPKDHQVHYKSGNIALQRRHRAWPSAQLIPLPETVNGAGGLHRDALAHLLIHTFGLRNGPTASPQRVDRWCATGGNLGSPTAYLIARSVEGLVPGVYGFSCGETALAHLAWADPHTPVRGIPDDAPAAIVVTGALDVVASKYGPFGWRILQLDAGVALTQAHRLSTSVSLRLEPAVAWDDERLSELIGASLDSEPITAVVTLHPASHASRDFFAQKGSPS